MSIATAVAGPFGCRQVLDLPSDVEPLDDIGDKACSCEPIVSQRDDVVAACQAGFDALEDDALLDLDECVQCERAVPCYKIVTGAADVGQPCTVARECTSFACCFEDAYLEINGSIHTVVECCDACLGCGDLIVDGRTIGATDLKGFCSDSFILAAGLAACLCDYAPSCTGPMRPCSDIPDLFGVGCAVHEASCRQCLFQASAGACAAEDDACRNDAGLPLGAE
jgi:hypothetical protein